MEENKYVPFSRKATPEAVKLELAEDWQRVMGCWLGKAVGGTLGTPYEGMDGLSNTYVPLDPSYPRRGKHDSTWRVIANTVLV